MTSTWDSLLDECRRDGASDADNGVFDLPYPGSDDPEDEYYNYVYKEGFDAKRKQLGDKFEWS